MLFLNIPPTVQSRGVQDLILNTVSTFLRFNFLSGETPGASFPYFPPLSVAKYFATSRVYLRSNLPRILFLRYPLIDIGCRSTSLCSMFPPREGADLQKLGLPGLVKRISLVEKRKIKF